MLKHTNLRNMIPPTSSGVCHKRCGVICVCLPCRQIPELDAGYSNGIYLLQCVRSKLDAYRPMLSGWLALLCSIGNASFITILAAFLTRHPPPAGAYILVVCTEQDPHCSLFNSGDYLYRLKNRRNIEEGLEYGSRVRIQGEKLGSRVSL